MRVRPLTFRDIEFKDHRLAKGGVQGLLNLPNNITISIVGGPQLYGDGVNDFEVASWYTDSGKWLRLGDHDDVIGYRDRDDIDLLIHELSKR